MEKQTHTPKMDRNDDYNNYASFLKQLSEHEFFNDGSLSIIEGIDILSNEEVVSAINVDKWNSSESIHISVHTRLICVDDNNFGEITLSKSQARQLRDYLTQVLEEM